MKNEVHISFVVFLSMLFTSLSAQTWNTADTLLSNNISQYNGNVVAMVMHNDSLVYYKAIGTYDSLTQKSIASLTKSFSGAVILRLAQEGALNLNDSIGVYLPYATAMGKGSNTIRQNFSHTAGWEGTTGNTYLTNPSLNMQQCVDSIITYDPIIYTPGTMFKYTGVSMQVAGRAAEIATGQNWNTLWENKIKNPLGLTNTKFGVITNPRVAGGLVSTPSDIIKFAQFILKNGKDKNGVQVVDSIWMQEMWQDQTNLAPIIAMPYPFNPQYNNPYGADTIRYGIGTWLDIYNRTQSYQEQISGGGAFGSIMWVNRCNNTCGVIFTYSSYSNVVQTSFQVIDVVNTIYPNQCYQTTSISENKNESTIFIYPNPATDMVHLQTENEIIKSIKIFNVQGEFIQKYFTNDFSVTNLAQGIYFIRVETDKSDFTNKLIKQ